MVWLWIALAAVLAAALLLLGAAVFFFKFSIRRYRKERADEQYEEADSIWNPFAPRMKEAQAYIRAHTREKVKLTSFDGLELAALYLPVERPRGTVIAFHGYRSLATIDFALEVEFLHRLRPERRFDGLEALRRQILRDAEEARGYFAQTGVITNKIAEN